jgi:hypothetical protein
MAHEIMIPDAAQLPAHIVNPELARQANEDAMANISTGMPPRIKMAGKTFMLVDGAGEETPVKAKQLVEGPDENMYLKTVVLRARKNLQKMWYAAKYDPNVEGQAPDCFSNDGEKPDSSIASPQSEVCANCPLNAYGSGTDANGNATGGKACSDNKILAVFLPNHGIHTLKITPASLKNWGLYVKKLNAAGIPVGNVFTLVGFDQTATFPVLTFQYGGPIPETAIAKLAEMAQSPEAEEVVSMRITAQAPATQASAKAEPKLTEAPKPAPAEVEEPAPADDLGLGLEDTASPAQTQEQTPDPAAAETLSDADIAAELGL